MLSMKKVKAEEAEKEKLPLSTAMEHLLEECRMVLPGIQMLFGFQLISVFNAGFDEKLTLGEQRMHLIAIVLVTLAIAFIMGPAALHRQTPREVNQAMITTATRVILCSMIPLSVGLSMDFYLVGRIILGNVPSAVIATALFLVIVTIWFVLPRVRALQHLINRFK